MKIIKNNKVVALLFSSILFVGCIEHYTKRAERLEGKGLYTEAIELWDKIIMTDANNVTAYINRGVDKSLLKDYDGAIEDYSKVIDIDSTNVLAWVNRGKNKERIEDYSGAIYDFNKAISIKTIGNIGVADNSLNINDVEYIHILFERGVTYYQTDSLRLAIHDLTKCVNSNNYLIRSLYYRGFCYLNLGDQDKAKQDFIYVVKNGGATDKEFVDEIRDLLRKSNVNID